MIKVLQIVPTLYRGGLETFVMNVYRAIDKSRVQFDFLTFFEGGDYCDEIESMGGVIYRIPSRRQGLIEFNRNLNNFFKKHQGEYDAVHYHESSLTSLEPLYYARKYGVHIRVMHSHSSSISGNKIHFALHYLGKFLISILANNYLGCSDKALDWFYLYSGVRNKAILIQNGINLKQFEFNVKNRDKIRNYFSIDSETIVIGHVGRLDTVKNHKFLIDIFKEFHNNYPNSVLWIIGRGELEQDLRKIVKDKGMEECISFLGVRTDTFDLYQAMDIFVMPSLFEGLPMVLVEAQTSGLPILCSDTISKMSRLTDNYHEMSLTDNAKIWADKIKDILLKFHRKDESESIKRSGFDIKSVAEFLTQLYNADK